MEDKMRFFYSQSPHHPLPNPAVGQLVAVRGEDGEELARAQVVEVTAPNKIKVSLWAVTYYEEYGGAMPSWTYYSKKLRMFFVEGYETRNYGLYQNDWLITTEQVQTQKLCFVVVLLLNLRNKSIWPWQHC